MLKKIEKDTAERMEKSMKALDQELIRIRTGRASVGLLDHITVDYYGSQVPLSQAANVTATDARTLTIQVWEKPMVAVIEKAIINSDLGLTPNTAGQVLHINLPPLTEERRRELVKVVNKEGEGAKIAIRNIRRDSNTAIKQLLDKKEVSEDDAKRAEGEVQKITDKFIEAVDKVLAAKEKELLEL